MNILLIQLRRIGDLILTTPAIRAVRGHFPQAKISLVGSHGARELLPAIPGPDRVFVARGQITDAASLFGIARRKFDYCLDFTRNDRSAFITLLSKARHRLAADYPRRRGKLQSASYNTLVPLDVQRLHTADYHLGLLQPLGIHAASLRLQLDLPASALQTAQDVLGKAGLEGEFILLHPGSARAEKFWEAERWAKLIAFVAKRGLTSVLTGGDSPLEQTQIAQIKSLARSPLVDLSGKIELLALAALIGRARLVVTVDSAPVHLAEAMQTPQVALFGPTNAFHWRPRFSPAIVLQAGQPAPLAHFSPDIQGAPMNLISTQQVFDAMEALLAPPRGALL